MKKLKLKYILPLLLAFVLVLGSCMTVCAASYSYSFPDDYIDYGYNFIVDDNGELTYWTCDKPFIVVKNDAGGIMHFSPDCSKMRRVDEYGRRVNYSCPKEIALTGLIVYSDHNICYRDGTIFFRVPLARLAVPLQAEIMKHLKVILPVGVGCLALLIGSVVLLPRLRRFLLRL